ncbi:peptidylprolyl isomerase [Candidatus Kaiserbacteria bacterium CG10_big_fil_rev_8_21_14_0_10_59_10]|uniref:Peptidyl-prolyl cis-trans isomerase n=1 Tax=Candidatus Kaiserbacteria bacterium CG10_big_fil_rev_8_21_14_0_10_59_10 TaxID=1974612 RepID=A0A2H0U9W8_9BACT|nr:MAG: peptidylprolyl isomerase [Candidatus Kaiserbacteria bacterium CG10_big_fil_rev_8_21_14_0_10_59_10]
MNQLGPSEFGNQPGLEGQVQGQDIVVGEGAEAVPGMVVAIEYIGALEDGTIFDSSEAQGQPLVFTLGVDPLIPGFQIGVNGMREGGRRIVSIPPELAYGAEGVVDAEGNVLIPANATLIFEIQLLAVMSPEAPELGTVEEGAEGGGAAE